MDVSEDDEKKPSLSFNEGLRNDGEDIWRGEGSIEFENDSNVDDGNDSDSTYAEPAIDNPYYSHFYETRSAKDLTHAYAVNEANEIDAIVNSVHPHLVG